MATDKKTDDSVKAEMRLRTDWPLCEKDEQSRTVEQYRKLQEEAGKRWSDRQQAANKNRSV
jgi:hypothetical protein